MSTAFDELCTFDNLYCAFVNAARGKRARTAVADFDFHVADHLLALQRDLIAGTYRPGVYRHFFIHEPKRRKISAAPFRDRVVHHALCNVIEPRFERLFIRDSYANRAGKGTHAAVNRLQTLARRFRFVLRLDIVRHFPSIDHDILMDVLARVIPEDDVMRLVKAIIASGDGVLADEYEPVFFPGDDLLSVCRPRGLPIGSLTSQFWSNCYLHPFDQFVVRELRCAGYVRYVDDFALFANDRATLWAWKRAIVDRLARLRLTIHNESAQVSPVTNGIPWLGFVVFPRRRRVKGRKVVTASRRLRRRFNDYTAGHISFAELDASVQGWINHVRYADTWGLRRQLFSQPWFRLTPARARAARRSNQRSVSDQRISDQRFK